MKACAELASCRVPWAEGQRAGQARKKSPMIDVSPEGEGTQDLKKGTTHRPMTLSPRPAHSGAASPGPGQMPSARGAETHQLSSLNKAETLSCAFSQAFPVHIGEFWGIHFCHARTWLLGLQWGVQLPGASS